MGPGEWYGVQLYDMLITIHTRSLLTLLYFVFLILFFFFYTAFYIFQISHPDRLFFIVNIVNIVAVLVLIPPIQVALRILLHIPLSIATFHTSHCLSWICTVCVTNKVLEC